MLNMRSHIDVNGVSSACADCHDPHGTSNLSMIRTSILGKTITFTDKSPNCRQTTNLGLCQVCHTQTNYFLAGVPETAHDSTDCLACHDHKSPKGGFMSRPAKQCDSCHGYPPAPRQTGFPVSFGTSATGPPPSSRILRRRRSAPGGLARSRRAPHPPRVGTTASCATTRATTGWT